MSILEYNPLFKYLPGHYSTTADGSHIFEEDKENTNKQDSFVVQSINLDMDLVREEQIRDSETVAIVGDLKLLNGLLYLKPLRWLCTFVCAKVIERGCFEACS